MAKDSPHIEYFHMGPWPVFVGATCRPKAFRRELRRLGVTQDVPFLGTPHANATTHIFEHEGQLTLIVTTQKRGRMRKEAHAALIAHEATHVVQEIRRQLVAAASPAHEGLGIEAEAYLTQYVTQEVLAVAWGTGRRLRSQPGSTKE